MTHHAAKDWITTWQSELAASASNRESQKNWVGTINTWVNAARDAATAWQAPPQDAPSKNTHCEAPKAPGHQTSACASANLIAAMAHELTTLRTRIENLERRLSDTSDMETTHPSTVPAQDSGP